MLNVTRRSNSPRLWKTMSTKRFYIMTLDIEAKNLFILIYYQHELVSLMIAPVSCFIIAKCVTCEATKLLNPASYCECCWCYINNGLGITIAVNNWPIFGLWLHYLLFIYLKLIMKVQVIKDYKMNMMKIRFSQTFLEYYQLNFTFQTFSRQSSWSVFPLLSEAKLSLGSSKETNANAVLIR